VGEIKVYREKHNHQRRFRLLHVLTPHALTQYTVHLALGVSLSAVFHALYLGTEGNSSTANMGLSDFVKKATTVVEKGVGQVADSLSVHPYLERPT
jgi:hypothetical protein